ncbi:FxsA family protein [Shewanella glacialipiscicola]|uniref:Membrane protein n=1 Tax=Shewanella glacialipiscicola TaxID=614069 RepID=A0ABQ6J813_9GAMM|nr:FxsA family protein [Shewanella glacialipiscicola]MCL1087118.1 FxsA family protein [Shewanella glacialipiscicola]GIU09992.1 membrane protein [Shewanella glacialipiscicola]GMA83420.1 membrane protein [Shewanella glacialipiscicola]
MFFIIFLLFVLIPVIELSVLIRVGEVLGTWTTIGLVLFTAVLGVSLVRSQGLSTLMQVQQKLARGEAPGQEIVEGMMLAMAGILLVIPGFVTDAIGLLFLTPLTRKPIAALLFKRMQLRVVAGLHGGFQAGQSPFGPKPQDPFGGAPFDDSAKKDGNVFEGDFEDKTEHNVDASDIKPTSHQITNKPIDTDLNNK